MLLENSTEGVEDDFNRGSEFCTHRKELYEDRPRRGRIWSIGILGIRGILMI